MSPEERAERVVGEWVEEAVRRFAVVMPNDETLITAPALPGMAPLIADAIRDAERHAYERAEGIAEEWAAIVREAANSDTDTGVIWQCHAARHIASAIGRLKLIGGSGPPERG